MSTNRVSCEEYIKLFWFYPYQPPNCGAGAYIYSVVDYFFVKKINSLLKNWKPKYASSSQCQHCVLFYILKVIPYQPG